ncbi:MAG TPA: hypothetical protein VHW44_14305 [Pseudonocardiaceae bacterium]|jgi:hypothetical protein|nr:hypothetical protein [Pseudonocardiaceae bacterium]
MPVNAQGRPMCRHQPATLCSRWWCTWKRIILFVLLPTILAVVLINGLVARQHLFFDQPGLHISYSR